MAEMRLFNALTMPQLTEARMSAAVKLQRAFQRQQEKSAASRKRGEEVMAQAKADVEKKNKQVNEFAPDNGGEEDILKKYARMWYKGNDAVQQKIEKVLDRMGWEIGGIESEEGGAFVVRSGDENGNSYIGFAQADLEEARRANTASARAEFGKRPRKDTLSDKEKDQKKSDSDEAWARLMAYADEQKKKEQGVGEADSKAMAQTAKRLTDPKDGATAKLRAAGDKRREEHLKGRDIAKRNEAMLPTSTFTGSDKNKLAPQGQLKGTAPKEQPTHKLVGETDKKKGADGKACWKGYKYAGTKNGKDKCVPIGEAWETEMASAVLKLLEGKL